VQDDECPLLGFERHEDTPQFVTVGGHVGGIGSLGLDRPNLAFRAGAPLLLARLAIARVDQQTSDPGVEGIGVAQALEVTPGADEGFLGGVVSPVVIPQDEPCDGVEPVDLAASQLRERVPIARHRPFDEIPLHRVSCCGGPSGRSRTIGPAASTSVPSSSAEPARHRVGGTAGETSRWHDISFHSFIG